MQTREIALGPDSGDVSLSYLEAGEGEPLLLVHGFTGAKEDFADEVDRLAVLGHHVVAPDLRGHGDSSQPAEESAYSLDLFASDLWALTDHLGWPAFDLLGHSMGGMIAQVMAIEHPARVRTLTSVMSNTGEMGYGNPEPELLAELIESTKPAADFDEAVEAAVRLAKAIGSPDYWDEESQRARQRAFLERNHDPAGTGRQLAATFSSGSRSEGLVALDVPTLVIHGTADRLVTPSGGRRTAELVPGARLVEVEGMGHDLIEPFWQTYLDSTGELLAAGRR